MINFAPTIQEGDVIAVGDIHGRFDLLDQLCDHVADSGASLIFLGDLIDRGPQDVEVLERVHYMIMSPESWGLESVTTLMGNHEWMFIEAATGSGDDFKQWRGNGGNFDAFADMLRHLPWIQRLPLYVTIRDTMFIHAGFYPGKDPAETIKAGYKENILWMREPFITEGPQFDKWNESLKRVVFGHTPQSALPYTIPGGGICIDTAAFQTGILTTYNATQNTFWSYDADA